MSYEIPSTDVRFISKYRGDYDFQASVVKEWGKPAYPSEHDPVYGMNPTTQNLISRSYASSLGTPMRCGKDSIVSTTKYDTVLKLKQDNVKAKCCSPFIRGNAGSPVPENENEPCGYAFTESPRIDTSVIRKSEWQGSVPKFLVDSNQAQIYLKNKGMVNTNAMVIMSKHLKIMNQMNLERTDLVQQRVDLLSLQETLKRSNSPIEQQRVEEQVMLKEQEIRNMNRRMYWTIINFLLDNKNSPEFTRMIEIVFANTFLLEHKAEFISEWNKLVDISFEESRPLREYSPEQLISKQNESLQFFGAKRNKLSKLSTRKRRAKRIRSKKRTSSKTY
jgi:hypothetical protein